MTRQNHLGLILLVAGVAAACAALPCAAQSTPAAKPDDNPAPCTVAPQPVPCGAAPAASNKQPAKQADKPSDTQSGSQPGDTQKFPFPGETSADGDAASPTPGPQTPNAPGASTQKPSGANFPFPGENPASAPGGSSSSSSGSSSSDNNLPGVPVNPPGAPPLNDKGSSGTQTGRRLLPRVNPWGTKLQAPEEREAEDLNVAHFYSQSGDAQGAYLRSLDAVKTAPDDPDAHFALAEAARKLNKRGQAIAEYKACLKLDPPDKEAKDALKELKKLQP